MRPRQSVNVPPRSMEIWIRGEAMTVDGRWSMVDTAGLFLVVVVVMMVVVNKSVVCVSLLGQSEEKEKAALIAAN